MLFNLKKTTTTTKKKWKNKVFEKSQPCVRSFLACSLNFECNSQSVHNVCIILLHDKPATEGVDNLSKGSTASTPAEMASDLCHFALLKL